MTIEYTVTTSINGQQLYITTCKLSVIANWQSSSVGKFCHGHAVYSNDLVTLRGSLQLRLYSSLTLTWAYREWSSITDANLTVGRTPDGEGNQSNVDYKCHCHHSVNNTDNSTWHWECTWCIKKTISLRHWSTRNKYEVIYCALCPCVTVSAIFFYKFHKQQNCQS